MAGSDYAVTTFGVALFSDILDAAPSASVRFVPWHSDILQSLTDGEVDLVFSGMRAASPFVSDLLFTDDMVCVVDRNHPLAHRDSITLDQYLASGHLIIDIDRGQQPSVDGVLAAMGRARAGTLTVPFHATAPLALADTQLILTMPARALHHYVTPRGEKLCVFPAPLQVKSLPYFMTWHSRVTHDKSHQWLRERVRHAIENNPEAR